MKNRTRKIVSIGITMIALIALMCVFSAGCGSSAVLTITENNKQYSTFGYGYVSVEVPETATSYNVKVSTGTGSESNKSRVEVIEDIRPTVVDVYGYAADGTSAGSGVIVYADASTDASPEYYFVVTNHHVIEGCSTFTVSLLFINKDTGEETYDNYSADLIGSSPSRDIAVLRIERKSNEEIKTATVIEDSDTVKVGMDVLAIGNPLGILGGTVTMGIVSATARTVTVDEVGSMTLMQTDAAINKGNSGGGLFDTNGNLIGIVNSGYSSYEGLNFAIPLNDARFAADSFLETYRETDGKVTQYGYVKGDTELGIGCRTMTNVYENSTSDIRGSYVVAGVNSTTSPLLPAWGTGSQAIISVKITSNGNTVDYAIGNINDMEAVMKTITAGDTIEFTYRSVKQIRVNIGMGLSTTKYYLDDNTQTAAITAPQYVYLIM